MPCLECGNPKTCRAHILPAALGKDIIEGSGLKTLSLLAPDRIDNSIQSGFFDDSILCSTCDGKLNRYDKHAIEIIRLAGTDKETISSGTFVLQHDAGIHYQHLALFAAAVVWRAAVSRRIHQLSGFTLGANESWFRQMIFRHVSDVPDVIIARVVGSTMIANEAAMAAMSYPVAIKLKSGRRMARFQLPGFMLLVRTSRAPEPRMLDASVMVHGQSSGPTRLTGDVMPFEQLADLRQVEQSKYIQNILYGTTKS